MSKRVTPHYIERLPILVIFPHSRCNCRCVMCDIWRIRQVREITAEDLAPHLESLRQLQVRWVVFSGGEPQMHSDLAALSRLLRSEGVRLTLLTVGLLLEPQAQLVTEIVDDVIVSLDGPPAIHDQVRRVSGAFEKLARGVTALRSIRPGLPISARFTIQRLNFRYLCQTLASAKDLGLDSISFLAVDLTSEAFNRPGGWPAPRQSAVALNEKEVEELERGIEALIRERADDIANGFVLESPDKLRRIPRHFRSHLGQVAPIAPRCNAPWVSAVIESDGSMRPCFFHASIGNIHNGPLQEILNSEAALRFRENLDVAAHPICRRCVCSLYLED